MQGPEKETCFSEEQQVTSNITNIYYNNLTTHNYWGFMQWQACIMSTPEHWPQIEISEKAHLKITYHKYVVLLLICYGAC